MVLSRKKFESIIIDGNIQVTIVSIQGDKVRIGIVAPKEIEVHRNEIYERIQEQKREEEEGA